MLLCLADAAGGTVGPRRGSFLEARAPLLTPRRNRARIVHHLIVPKRHR